MRSLPKVRDWYAAEHKQERIGNRPESVHDVEDPYGYVEGPSHENAVIEEEYGITGDAN